MFTFLLLSELCLYIYLSVHSFNFIFECIVLLYCILFECSHICFIITISISTISNKLKYHLKKITGSFIKASTLVDKKKSREI